MKILNIKATYGPNYWSVKRHRLIVMQLDIGELETQPTDKINGFYQRIEKVFPGLYEHHCSEGEPGGFLSRVKRGTWIGHVIEHIALELQVLAGLQVGFGRTRGTGTNGHYHVVFDCIDEESGRLTAEKAVAIAQDLVDGSAIDVDQHVQEIREENRRNMPGPSTASLLREASDRNIPSIKLEDNSTYQLGYGCFQKKIAATITSSTSNMAVELACDKEACRNIFREMSIPVAEGGLVYSIEELKTLLDTIGFPVVVKPVSGNQGRGVTTNLKTFDAAVKAFQSASEVSAGVIVERHISGNDYRLLTVDDKLVAVAKRTPARVKGNGELTIRQLIDKVNEDPRRGEGHEKALTKITIGHTAKAILSKKGYTLNTILSQDEILYLDHAANLSKGGTAEDVTDRVHPQVKMMAERISKIVGLDICGIDVMATTLQQPLYATGGVVLEVNAAPGFRMHLSPSKGESRNVAAPVMDMLFPRENKSRIPIIAVTGTNGKTTTTRLISHILKGCGRRVGYTTTDGVYVNDQLVMKGDCGGPKSAEIVLKDPTVNTAVLECARGGILRSGLGFDRCDVAVVTNVAADHLGIKGINDLRQMASLKSVVAESVRPSGYAVLNADDDRVYAMRNNVGCNVVLFSTNADNPRLVTHRKTGGISAVYKDRHIIIWDGNASHIVEKIDNVPLSFGGRAEFMIANILAATAVAYTQNIALADIRKLLHRFLPSPEQTPGRMNLFSFENYDVLVDYAHNAAGMVAIKNFLDSATYSYKIGIVTGIGDRRDEDNIEMGRLSAEIFDKVIIREDTDLRGKESGEITEIVKKGIANSSNNPAVVAISDEKKALRYAMQDAQPGTLIMLCAENIGEVIAFMNEQQAKQKSRKLPVLKKHFDNKIAAGMHLLEK
jgi:cyanophycin synthetase